ncbi:MAG: D-2-hydroxyacid dehydrogenase [Mangrovibacterium sp.]
MKIVVLDTYSVNPGDLSFNTLEDLGTVQMYELTQPQEVIERARDAEIILTNKVLFSKDIITELPQLKYIGILATGVNNVDLDAAREAGITVTNIPAYSTDSVAQMVFAHFLCVTNHVEDYNKSVHEGAWVNSPHFCFYTHRLLEMSGKTLGIVGFGKIGQTIAKIALAFGMQVIFVNRSNKEGVMPRTKQVGMNELFSKSDFISLNAPLTADNEGFINANLLDSCKKEVIISNTGRGALVNEHDMANALRNQTIQAYCTDVLSQEPPQADNPLLQAKNCYLTPHVAWASVEARRRLIEIAVQNVRYFLENSPQNVVNF